MDHTAVIDADAHVEEDVATWDFLDEEFRDRRPIPVLLEGDQYRPIYGDVNAYWLIDGRPTNVPVGKGSMISLTPPISRAAKAKPFSTASQSLADVGARLSDMDKVGVTTQVLFPTVFNRPPTDDDRFLTALHRSYNTWLAGRCAEAPERLKWAAVMPLQEVDEAVRELNRAAELGAVAALCYPMVRGKTLDDRSLYPFYAEADRLGIPITVHIGWYSPELNKLCDNLFTAQTSSLIFPLQMSFLGIIGSDLLERFPNLRFAFLEAGASWLLYLVEHMDHYYAVNGAMGWWRPTRSPTDWIKSGRIYLSFETDEALLPQVADFIGEDHLLLSTDMPHSELRDNAVSQLAARNDLSDEAKRKIRHDNPMRFYGLSV